LSVAACRSCGEVNADNARFCHACGSSLDDDAARLGQREVRKTVTVLFADVAGSTAIGERLDGFSAAFEPLEGHAGSVPPGLAPLTSAHLVHVRVDPESGEVAVLDYVIAQDVGRALNPALVEDQLHGGATQGLGWALHEAMLHDETGQLLTGTFLDYALPTATKVPRFETILVEIPSADGPYGAKGVGEGPVCGAAAAVANAVAAATGVRYRSLPMTAQKIWREMARGGAA